MKIKGEEQKDINKDLPYFFYICYNTDVHFMHMYGTYDTHI